MTNSHQNSAEEQGKHVQYNPFTVAESTHKLNFNWTMVQDNGHKSTLKMMKKGERE